MPLTLFSVRSIWRNLVWQSLLNGALCYGIIWYVYVVTGGNTTSLFIGVYDTRLVRYTLTIIAAIMTLTLCVLIVVTCILSLWDDCTDATIWGAVIVPLLWGGVGVYTLISWVLTGHTIWVDTLYDLTLNSPFY